MTIAIAGAIVAVAVFVLAAPDDDEREVRAAGASDVSSRVQIALDDAAANEGLADSAPQQQVVNGWVARDLLDIQTGQLDDISRQLEAIAEQPPPADDHRPAALLTVAVVVLASPSPPREPRRANAHRTPARRPTSPSTARPSGRPIGRRCARHRPADPCALRSPPAVRAALTARSSRSGTLPWHGVDRRPAGPHVRQVGEDRSATSRSSISSS